MTAGGHLFGGVLHGERSGEVVSCAALDGLRGVVKLSNFSGVATACQTLLDPRIALRAFETPCTTDCRSCGDRHGCALDSVEG